MNTVNLKQLPPDLVQYLSDKKKFDYDPSKSECGMVTLKNIDELTISKIYVDSEYSPLKGNDPHYKKKGYYEVNAIDLVAQCDESYDPEGILIWLPEYSMYGTWDSDHWHLIVFPRIKWPDIVKDPLKFLKAQWDPSLGGGEYLKVWEKSVYKAGRPF